MNELRAQKTVTVVENKAKAFTLAELKEHRPGQSWPEGSYTVNLKEVKFEAGIRILITMEDDKGNLYRNNHPWPTDAHKDGYATVFCKTMETLAQNLGLSQDIVYTEDFEQELQNSIGKQILIVTSTKLNSTGEYQVYGNYATKEQHIQAVSQSRIADLTQA